MIKYEQSSQLGVVIFGVHRLGPHGEAFVFQGGIEFLIMVFTMFRLKGWSSFSFNFDVGAKCVKTCHRLKEI